MPQQSLFKGPSSSIDYNVVSVTPLQLSWTFNIPVNNLLIRDEEKNAIFADAENNAFFPQLIPNKVYDVLDKTNLPEPKKDNQLSKKTLLALIPSEIEQKAVVQKVIKHSVIASLDGPAKALSNLVSACASIEYLMVTAATIPDFSLISSTVNNFLFLKNPASMKDTVIQVAQQMKEVIDKNTSDLDVINLKTSFLSEQFKYVLPAIWTGNDSMIVDIAKRMNDATELCIKKSDECVKRCENVVSAFKELMRAFIGSQTDVEKKDINLCRNLKQLNEYLDLLNKQHALHKKDLDAQQIIFNRAYAEHQKQQGRNGSFSKHLAARVADIFTLGFANARKGMDNDYKKAVYEKNKEEDIKTELHGQLKEVENKLMDHHIRVSKDKIEKEGLQGIIEAIGEAIKKFGDLNSTVQNMQKYFQTINNFIKITIHSNAQIFIENSRKIEPTPLDNEQTMESVVTVYAAFYAVQSFAKIFSIAASTEMVQSRLSHAKNYLGYTLDEAKAKQHELKKKDTHHDTMALNEIIVEELTKATAELNENITELINYSIQTAKMSIQN
jgi:hypothetical protein